MSEITLKLRKFTNNSYKIFIQPCALKLIPKFLKEQKIGKKYAIITDKIVAKLFGKSLLNQLKNKSIKAEIIYFPEGEKSKFLSTVENLCDEMIKKGFDRKDAIIALGGGVVGDIAGFIASIYMRGIPYIQVPTTLMAMVDSAIGGKTGVDLPSGKNLIGTIYQPKAVFIDIDIIKNLPEKQIRNGLAEIIKYGVIKSKKLFKFLEQNLQNIFNKNKKTLTYIIEKSVKIKIKIVQKDEKDIKETEGKRIILNYGHTYGHAIEKLSGFKLLHGFAISIGMVLANKMAVEKGILKQKTADRIKKLLKNAGLPVITMKKITKKDLLSDKKKEGNYIKFILPKKIGKAIVYKEKCQ